MGEGRRPAANSRRAREGTRVASHIARAEKFAHENKVQVESLDPLRSLVRALLLDALREYREAGEFPENHRRPCNTPVFVDERGTHCAVGHLLSLSGWGALVEKIATERNLATVHELSNEPELVAWLEATGLTVEEAALIQPGYSPACGTAEVCFCLPYLAPNASSNTSIVPGPMVATAVLDGTIVAPNTARVDRIYGTTTGHAVGETVFVGAFRGGEATRVLVAVDADGRQPVQWRFGVDASASAHYVGIGVAINGTASCSFQGLMAPGVTLDAPAQAVIEALISNDCRATLARAHPPSLDRKCGGCTCATPASASRDAPSQATLSILLTLVGALMVRRARRIDTRRPR